MNHSTAISRSVGLRATPKLAWAALCCSMLVPSMGYVSLAQDNPTAAKPTIKTPSDERIYADISYLASDELKGRAAETPGLKLAADFIAKRFGELGLQTDLFDGQPFQYFEITGNPGASSETNSLELTKPDGTKIPLELSEDFQPQAIGSNGEFSAPLVFAGYGITANEENFKYDDYEGLDVKGKAVLVIR